MSFGLLRSRLATRYALDAVGRAVFNALEARERCLGGEVRTMHRRAEKLAERFNQASMQRMAKGNERGAPTEPLFHYASAAALSAIIASETFWFTSVYYMDDDQELLFGFGICHALLAAALEREDANVKVFLKPLVEDVGFTRIRNRFE